MVLNRPATINFRSAFKGARNYLKAIPRFKRQRVLPGSYSRRQRVTKSRFGKRLDEKLIQYLWAEQYFGHLHYHTLEGNRLKVIFPGFLNLGKGPDFKQAQIESAGIVCQGDIEVHLWASDWYKHQHHQANDYKQVILHVALWNDIGSHYVETKSQKKIPQLILAPFLKPYLEELDWILDLPRFWQASSRSGGVGPCYSLISSSRQQTRLVDFVLMAGEARLVAKLTEFRKRLIRLRCNYANQSITYPYDEIIYQGLMEALGYKNNRHGFITLANDIPYRKLKKITDGLDNIPELIKIASAKGDLLDSRITRTIIIQAILFWYSGLITDTTNHHSFNPVRKSDDRDKNDCPDPPDDITKLSNGVDTQTRFYLKTLRSIWSCLLKRKHLAQPNHRIEWNFYGTRPTNYPQRRIAGVSYLLAGILPKNDLITAFRYIFSNRQNDLTIIDRLNQFFVGSTNDYWSRRSKLGAPTLRRGALIGRDRISAIVVNIILPLMMLYVVESRTTAISLERLLTVYKKTPPLADNYITSFMKHRLLGNERRKVNYLVKNAYLQQGLFQVFRDFCMHGYRGCQNCGLIHYLKTGRLRASNKTTITK